eukprot:sb/3462363/
MYYYYRQHGNRNVAWLTKDSDRSQKCSEETVRNRTMPQEYQLPDRVYHMPFELIMLAYEKRFPKCDMIPAFLGSETLSEHRSRDKAIHVIERRCKIDVDAPYILKKMCGADYVYFIQKNSLNRRNRTLHIVATNETFASRVRIKEECSYKVLINLQTEGYKVTDRVTKLQTRLQSYRQDDDDDSFASADEEQALRDFEIYNHSLLESTTTPLKLPFPSVYYRTSSPIMISHSVQIPDERVLLRFLRARNFEIEKTREMLIKSMAWRKQYNIDAHLDFWSPPDVINRYLPGAWHKTSKDGRPVYVLRLGHMDVKGVLRSVGEEALLRHALYICEQGIEKTKETPTISSWTLLIDLEGLNLRHLWAPARLAMRRFTEVMEQNYPETLGMVLIVQAPRLFPLAWTLVKGFINENTRRKCLVYAGSDYLEEDGIHSYIRTCDIPDFLGGPSKCDIECNGLVPREEYTLSTEEVLSHEDAMQSLYKNVTLKKGEMHEVTVEADADSVITWDFDCVLGGFQFSLYQRTFSEAHCNSSLAAMVQMAGITYPSTPSPTETYSDVLVDDGKIVDYIEGDSVQGSYYVGKSGTYVLTWSNTSQTPKTQAIAQKATFLYTIEMIEPKDYAGSVSSLTSSFSNLSPAGSCWNTSSVASWNSMSPTETYSDVLVDDGKIVDYIEGDSVQGSYYVGKSGTYVLTWSNTSQTPKTQAIAQKATFLYTIEMIEPKDYAGSVSSLTSSFSNLSPAGSCWNTSSVASWNSMQ